MLINSPTLCQVPLRMIKHIWSSFSSIPCPLSLGDICLGAFYSSSAAAAKSLQSSPTLCDPIDGSPPGSPVPGILQARILEWVAISFSNAWKWKVKVKSLYPNLNFLFFMPGTSIVILDLLLHPCPGICLSLVLNSMYLRLLAFLFLGVYLCFAEVILRNSPENVNCWSCEYLNLFLFYFHTSLDIYLWIVNTF